jgi:hypothetical protein
MFSGFSNTGRLTKSKPAVIIRKKTRNNVRNVVDVGLPLNTLRLHYGDQSVIDVWAKNCCLLLLLLLTAIGLMPGDSEYNTIT